MANTFHRELTLTRLPNNQVRITVHYHVTFSPRERCMTTCGVRFRERISVMGVDDPPPGPAGDSVLALTPNFTSLILPVTAGNVPQTLVRTRSIVVPRQQLNEDPGLFDSDEIRARIQIIPTGLPATHTGFTDMEILPGAVLLPAAGEEALTEEVEAEAVVA